MKVASVLAVLSVAVLLAANASADCLDISGIYASPYRTPDSKTSFIISQSACSGAVVMAYTFSPGMGTTRAHFSLDGTPARNCALDLFTNCGSLKAGPDEIEKTDGQPHPVNDPTHGLCRFTSTYLTKDEQGNVVETVRTAICKDGYRGALKPLIYKKEWVTPDRGDRRSD